GTGDHRSESDDARASSEHWKPSRSNPSQRSAQLKGRLSHRQLLASVVNLCAEPSLKHLADLSIAFRRQIVVRSVGQLGWEINEAIKNTVSARYDGPFHRRSRSKPPRTLGDGDRPVASRPGCSERP